MRAILLLALTLLCGQFSGCKTAEIAVDHQMTGIHVVAKFEGKDPIADEQEKEESRETTAAGEGVRVEYVTRRL